MGGQKWYLGWRSYQNSESPEHHLPEQKVSFPELSMQALKATASIFEKGRKKASICREAGVSGVVTATERRSHQELEEAKAVLSQRCGRAAGACCRLLSDFLLCGKSTFLPLPGTQWGNWFQQPGHTQIGLEISAAINQ